MAGKKKILLIADDQKTAAAVQDALRREYNITEARTAAAAESWLADNSADLVIIDHDLRTIDGLQLFRQLGISAKTIMLSSSGSIPLAVNATKQGIEEFLRKPIEAGQLRKAVERNISSEDVVLRWLPGLEWLSGGSRALAQLFSELKRAMREDKHIILLAERGIDRAGLTRLIHANSPRRERKLVTVDLSAFNRETLEAAFWTTLQELMSLPGSGSVQQDAGRCGTIMFDNLEPLDVLFQQSLLNFFVERRGKIDRSVRAVFALYNEKPLTNLDVAGLALVHVPPLRQRKADLAHLVDHYLAAHSAKYGKEVKYISGALLDLLATYDYPGNYEELSCLIEEMVLACRGDHLALSDQPLGPKALCGVAAERARRRSQPLPQARRAFESDLYHMLLKKSGGDSSRVASFLDLPRTLLAERLDDLLD
ncbi:MAG: sigma-54-dependent Fis family transcriptional regulator [Candidatus Saganbacteria bacterium]|nr:sigma-54-dependent Fis family transcriptional regulator [Candidatus Saganbacteria bacterium]